jgi:hypothetical protein
LQPEKITPLISPYVSSDINGYISSRRKNGNQATCSVLEQVLRSENLHFVYNYYLAELKLTGAISNTFPDLNAPE